MKLSSVPRSILTALGLAVPAAPACNPTCLSTTGAETSSPSTTSGLSATSTSGPCLSPTSGASLTSSGPCLSPPPTTDFTTDFTTGSTGGSTGTGPDTDTDTDTATGTGTGSSSSSGSGPCLSPPSETGMPCLGVLDEDHAVPSQETAPGSLREAAIARVLASGLLPPDVAARLRGGR